ncbi:MAG: hypothetical protein ISR51_05120 [Rhodospirillales bacterium]|nr:hypothetical protein [Rhodospirillales bacterium]
MAKPPDLQYLAKQYLDLWQGQLGGVSKDPKTGEIMAQTMELMNAGAQAFATMVQTAQDGSNDQGNSDGNAPPSNSSGVSAAQPAGAASGAANADLDEFARRLERIEERLDTLESKARKRRKGPAKKS